MPSSTTSARCRRTTACRAATSRFRRCRPSSCCRSSPRGATAPTASSSSPSSRRSTWASPGGRSGGYRSGAGSVSPRPSSSPSGPCSGTPPRSARLGTRPTSWPSAWRSSPWGSHSGPIRTPRPTRTISPNRSRRPSGRRRPATAPRAVARVVRALRSGIDGRQFLAGLLFGLACTSRLSILFAAPFFVLVGGGGTWLRRGFSAGLGAAIPVGALLLYNFASTGHFFHPGYQFLYEQEAGFYTTLGYNLSWGIEDPRYIPQNLGIMLFNTPAIEPTIYPAGLGGGRALCTDPAMIRGLFEPDCPIALPLDTGMSVILTSPAFLFALPALRRYGRSRAVTGAALAVLIIAVVNLMHFSQGWVQFGYRFSLDFVPWALLLVALGMERIRSGAGVAIAVVLVASRSPSTGGASSGATCWDGEAGGSRAPGAGRRGGHRNRARRLAPHARRRLLGHRGVPDDPADPRDGPSDRLPDVHHPWLARLDRPGAVRRARVPDEPPVGDPHRRRRGDHRRSGPPADPLEDRRGGRRARPRGHADRVVHRHPRRPPRAPPRAVRRRSSGCSSAGRSPASRTRRVPTAG